VLEKVGIALPQTSLPGASLILPLIYGVGTAVPVLIVALLLAYSAKSVGKTYNILSKVEWWARTITGTVFLVVGIWFSVVYVFEFR
jgi:cytochrome c biogenesis protein CcdA